MRIVDATRIAQDGLAVARQRGERGVEGQILRTLGEIAAHRNCFDVDTAEAYYRQAHSLADALGMRPLVAHCHFGFGKLFRRIGKQKQAREHLTTTATLYRKMDMTFWLEEVEAEMRELV